MAISSVGGYNANISSGTAHISYNSYSMVLSSVISIQLVESDSMYLYWLSTNGNLKRASIRSNSLILENEETLLTGITSFYARDLPGVGQAYACVSGQAITIYMPGGISYTGAWSVERLPDFSFDISNDLKTISILYMRPGSPIQAYVEQYSQVGGPIDPPDPPSADYFIPNSPTGIYYHFYNARYENY